MSDQMIPPRTPDDVFMVVQSLYIGRSESNTSSVVQDIVIRVEELNGPFHGLSRIRSLEL